MKSLLALGFLAFAAASAAAQPVARPNPTIVERAAELGPGQYVWDSKAPLSGPLLLTIDLSAQRVMVYRDGALIAASAISTGSLGRETPTGVFTILEKKVMHRSTTYDNAPMPYTLRLTGDGVSIHGSDVRWGRATHGCIGVPVEFAHKLYDQVSKGDQVVIVHGREPAKLAS